MNSFFEGFKDQSENISTIIISILLLIVYIFGVGITFFISRLFNKRFLKLGFEKNTYWEELNLKKKEKEDYYNQY